MARRREPAVPAVTEAGRLLAGRGRQLLHESAATLALSRRAARGEAALLRIGFGIASILGLLPAVLLRFRQAYPAVELQLRDMSTPEQGNALGEGTIDVGFVRLPVADRRLRMRPVIHERLVAALGPRSPWKRQLGLRSVAAEPFIIIARARSASFYDHALSICAASGFAPRVVQEANELFTVLSLVGAGALRYLRLVLLPFPVRLRVRPRIQNYYTAQRMALISSTDMDAPVATRNLTYGRKHQSGLNAITTVAMSAFHVGAVAALFFVDTGAILMALVLYCVAGMLGIGMGYHRLLTHRGYKTHKWTEYFLAWCGTLALEGGPIFWVATHRIHHQHSDREGDPHTPREGTWWAHAGWILSGEGLHHDASVLARYVPDLMRDRGHVLLSRWHWTSNVIVGLALLAYGGVPYVLWGIFFRTTVGLHATWLVNSATHKWGARRFATRDDSTNNWWVALLTFGEGWHNNHHAHPTSARHGLAWYELDLNWIGIRAMQALGLAWDVKLATRTSAPLAVPPGSL